VGSIIEPAGALVPFGAGAGNGNLADEPAEDDSSDAPPTTTPKSSSVLVPDELEGSLEERTEALRGRKLDDVPPSPPANNDSI
jgi:hypothetical protein